MIAPRPSVARFHSFGSSIASGSSTLRGSGLSRNFGSNPPGARTYPGAVPTLPNEFDVEVELEAGDVLYVPLMWPHLAIASGDEPSLSISIGFTPYTMLDAVVAAAKECPELRQPLDLSRPQGEELLNHLSSRLTPDEVARRFDEYFVSNRPTLVSRDRLHDLRAARALSPTQMVVRRADVPFRLGGDSLMLQDVVLSIPSSLRQAVERACSDSGAWATQDLPGRAGPAEGRTCSAVDRARPTDCRAHSIRRVGPRLTVIPERLYER